MATWGSPTRRRRLRLRARCFESFFSCFVALCFGEVGLLFKQVFLRFGLLFDQIFLSFLLAFGTGAERCECESRSDESYVVEFHEVSP